MTSPLDLIARLRHDVRALALPPPARLALYHLASEGGAIHTANLTTAAAFELLERGAGESVGRALDLGVIEHLHAVMRLVFTAPDGGDIGRGDPSIPAQGPAAPRAEASPARPSQPPAAMLQRPPSQSPEAQRQRKVLAWFKTRSGPCASVPDGVTWEAWSTSAEGADLLRVGRPRGGARAKVAGVVPCSRNKVAETKEQPRGEQGASKEQPKNEQGTTKEQPKEQPPSETERHSAELPEEKKETTNDDARGAAKNNPGDDQRTTPATTKEQPRQGTTPAPAAEVKEQPPVARRPFTPDPASETPRVDALVAADGIVEPAVSQRRELEAALIAAQVSVDDAYAWGKSLATPFGRKLSWVWLRKPEGDITARFLRESNGEQWSRVADGFKQWCHWRKRQPRAAAQVVAAGTAPAKPHVLPVAKVATAAAGIARSFALRNAAIAPAPMIAPPRHAGASP